jgi:hypothetical protein
MMCMYVFLETIFIGPEEANNEFSVDDDRVTDRFVGIDIDVKKVLIFSQSKITILTYIKDPKLVKTLESTDDKLEMFDE